MAMAMAPGKPQPAEAWTRPCDQARASTWPRIANSAVPDPIAMPNTQVGMPSTTMAAAADAPPPTVMAAAAHTYRSMGSIQMSRDAARPAAAIVTTSAPAAALAAPIQADASE